MAATERSQHTGRSRRSFRAAVTATAVTAIAAGAVACGSSEEPLHSIGYAIDGTVTTYNANTVDGAASGARQALARVQPGFGYVGPAGRVVSDTDIGTATVMPADRLTVQYRLAADSVYSDGVPMSCDDLVLAWAAASGRFTAPDETGAVVNVFDSAQRGGYADIDRVECQPGSKDATVVFRADRGDTDWRSLFGATELLPSHVVARASGVADPVAAITTGDIDAVRRMAEFWNTGWNLTPGALDPALVPSAGPYRIESYTVDDGLVLVANERWWGNRPATDTIVVWPRGTAASAAAEDGRIHVVDSAEGALEGVGAGDGAAVTTGPSRNVEQLTLATRGVFENAAARRAFALCIPRTELFEQFGKAGDVPESGIGAGPVDSRVLGADSPLYPGVAGTASRYAQPDTEAAKNELAGSGQDRITVRVGYLGPDARRARTVELIAGSCRDAGIEVVDAASETFTPSQLTAGQVDAVLAGTAAVAGAGGRADQSAARDALHSGTGSNVGDFANRRVDEILDALLVTSDNAAVAGLAGEAETILWNEMPTVPLFAQPRTAAFAPGMHVAVANPTTAGAGWNMDRWILTK